MRHPLEFAPGIVNILLLILFLMQRSDEKKLRKKLDAFICFFGFVKMVDECTLERVDGNKKFHEFIMTLEGFPTKYKNILNQVKIIKDDSETFKIAM